MAGHPVFRKGFSMLKRTGWIVFVFMIPALLGDCGKNPRSRPVLHKPDSRHFLYTGRIDFTDPGKPRLSSAGAYIQARFKGSACSILLEDQNLNNNHNYISVVIDGEYLGRVKISRNIVEYPLVSGLPDREHTLQVIKATESQIGYIDFLGLICERIFPVEGNLKRKIEFIGNSITCGMGLDMSGIPCDSGEWYDQHNAYLAYGPKAAGELHADWLLSSVSGIGITRNWNSPGPTMPQVYANTFLDTNPQLIWDRDSYVPDLVSVCLGTNDFSDGDGSYDRAELDSAQFVNDYIRFIQFFTYNNTPTATSVKRAYTSSSK